MQSSYRGRGNKTEPPQRLDDDPKTWPQEAAEAIELLNQMFAEAAAKFEIRKPEPEK